jgi:hypothetical protein
VGERCCVGTRIFRPATSRTAPLPKGFMKPLRGFLAKAFRYCSTVVVAFPGEDAALCVAMAALQEHQRSTTESSIAFSTEHPLRGSVVLLPVCVITAEPQFIFHTEFLRSCPSICLGESALRLLSRASLQLAAHPPWNLKLCFINRPPSCSNPTPTPTLTPTPRHDGTTTCQATGRCGAGSLRHSTL